MTRGFFYIPPTDLFLSIVVVTLFLMFMFLFVPVVTYSVFASDLVSKESITNKNNTGVVLLDRKGRPFFSFYNAQSKTDVSIDEIPALTREAFIAIEDKDFYRHQGISPKAIARAVVYDLLSGKLAYGGSTITQQLAKNSLLGPRKDFLRKYQEIILAQELEHRFKKDEILEMYLNSVYFGRGALGIEQAAEVYFNKHARDLSLAESALLAGILPSPSTLNPIYGDSTKAKERQTLVLKKMVEQGYINQEQGTEAAEQTLSFRTNPETNVSAAHFALFVKSQLVGKYGEEQISRSGFRVRTTLDLDWQKLSERIVTEQVEHLEPKNVKNGAVVVIDPKTGEILALVGSKNWNDDEFGKVNVATSLRQPGSAFKPIVYATAFENKLITPTTLLSDTPTAFPGNYQPRDYDGKTRGTVVARRALANSLNIPSVQVMTRVGVPKVLNTARLLGISSLKNPTDYGLSLVLGTGEVQLLELTSAYSVFANGGLRNTPVSILEIKDKEGNIVYSYSPEPERVISPESTFLISSILSDKVSRREIFGSSLDLPFPAAVKTGTSQNYRDSWTIGYTPSLAIGSWVGNNDARVMNRVAGALGAAPIWKELMKEFLKDKPVENFDPPAEIVVKTVCRYNGLLVKDSSTPGYKEYFIQGTQPTKFCVLPEITQNNDSSATN